MNPVTPKDLENSIRQAAGTWSHDEFVEYLNTTKLTKQERALAVQDFKEGESMLREFCKQECYNCSIHVLENLPYSTCQTLVQSHNQKRKKRQKVKKKQANWVHLNKKLRNKKLRNKLRGGKKDDDFDLDELDDDLDDEFEDARPLVGKLKKMCSLCDNPLDQASAGVRFLAHEVQNDDEKHEFHLECLRQYCKDTKRCMCPHSTCNEPVAVPEPTPHSSEHPTIIQDCPQWDEKKRCVMGPVKDYEHLTKKTCIPQKNVIGYGPHALSDGQCYDQEKLREWVGTKAKPGKMTSPYIRNHTFTSGNTKKGESNDLELIRGPMLENELRVQKNMVHEISTTFVSNIREWKVGNETNEAVMSTKTKKDVESSLVTAGKEVLTHGAAGVVGAATATLGAMALSIAAAPAIAVGGAILGVLAINKKFRDFLINSGIDLAIWIVKDPKTALMFLTIVKIFLKSACKDMAKLLQLQTFERTSTAGYYMGGASSYLNTFMEGGEIAIPSIIRGLAHGEGWKKVWKSGGNLAVTAVASIVPGGALVQAGVSTLVGGLVDCAEEAAQAGIELCTYRKDIEKGTELVGDILKMVLDPIKCMKTHGVARFTSCGDLITSPYACKGRRECLYTPVIGVNPASCEPKSCTVRHKELNSSGTEEAYNENKKFCELGDTCVLSGTKSRPACKTNIGGCSTWEMLSNPAGCAVKKAAARAIK